MLFEKEISKKKKDKPDDLLECLNSYHPNIVFTVEENPDHFLDTSLTYVNKFNCKVYKKPGKLLTHWKSEIPTKWKRNCITGTLHRVKRISSDFDNDVKTFETSFLSAGYPKHFISHTVNSFLKDPPEDDVLIPNSFSKSATKFLSRFRTEDSLTKQIKGLFNLKDKTLIDHMWSIKETVLAVTVTSARP